MLSKGRSRNRRERNSRLFGRTRAVAATFRMKAAKLSASDRNHRADLLAIRGG